MQNKEYGLLTYSEQKGYNIGDYIQSLAAKQYLPRVDHFVSRDQLSDFNKTRVKMIMNGWYMRDPAKWPPSDLIDPLFISVHINSGVKDRMLNDAGINYFKHLGKRIGCRDIYTVDLLQSKGIDAYYTGCLTTTLDLKYKTDKRSDSIYIVDPFYYNPSWEKLLACKSNFAKGILSGEILKVGVKQKLMHAIFKKDLLKKAEYIKHWYDKEDHSEEERFVLADQLLKKYAAAKLVITSRIHCALPCLALGTPVIFLNYGLDSDVSICRLNGIIDLFNVISIDKKGNMKANFDLPHDKIGEDFKISNPGNYKKLADALKAQCMDFIQSEQ